MSQFSTDYDKLVNYNNSDRYLPSKSSPYYQIFVLHLHLHSSKLLTFCLKRFKCSLNWAIGLETFWNRNCSTFASAGLRLLKNAEQYKISWSQFTKLTIFECCTICTCKIIISHERGCVALFKKEKVEGGCISLLEIVFNTAIWCVLVWHIIVWCLWMAVDIHHKCLLQKLIVNYSITRALVKLHKATHNLKPVRLCIKTLENRPLYEWKTAKVLQF